MFPDEDSATARLESLEWPDGGQCPCYGSAHTIAAETSDLPYYNVGCKKPFCDCDILISGE